MLGRLVNRALTRVPPEHVWGETLPVLRGADAVVCNLECVIADGGRPQPGKTFTFRSNAAHAAILSAGNVAAVSLANNHALDYGTDAMLECLALLDARGIAHAGAGPTLDAAQRPAVFSAAGTTVALIACTDNEPGWAAGPHHPGVFYVPIEVRDHRFEALREIVSTARPGADVVIVSVHWGPNWGYEPPPEHVEAARVLIDAGADVIFGHSPHVFRGIGVYRERPVLYGAGDFVDDYAVDPGERNDQSFMYVCGVLDGRVRSLTLIPTIIRNFRAVRAAGAERAAIEWKMARLCKGLGTALQPAGEGLVLPIA